MTPYDQASSLLLKAGQRIQPLVQLATLSERAKASGLSVVFTNGIFDFIHAGHLGYLEQAAALGDLLIVGLNSDASTRQLKGPTRPINPQQDRALVVAGLRCVDYVVVFQEQTPEAALEAIKPSFHVKGGDYTPEQMPETSIVRKNGGEVVIVPLKSGYSNSRQYDKIASAQQAQGEQVFQRPDWLAGQ